MGYFKITLHSAKKKNPNRHQHFSLSEVVLLLVALHQTFIADQIER